MPEPLPPYVLDFKQPTTAMSLDRERMLSLASVLTTHPHLAGRIFTAMRNGETRQELAKLYGQPYSVDGNGTRLFP